MARLPCIFATCLLPLTCQAGVSPKVETQFGVIYGAYDKQLQAASFKGIPFAEPPERFARAKPWTRRYGWFGRLHATSWFGFPLRTICPQHVSGSVSYNFFTMSEDCLFLNIYMPWTPSKSSAAKDLPVMMWIHGGALSYGSAMSNGFDGSRLAVAENVMIVVPNYRLGALGFAATVQSDGVTANLGLTDQQEAMRWIRANVAAFGGNPKQVTIFGESAGGLSVLLQMVSSQSGGLFDRAISSSADATIFDPVERNLAHTDMAAKKLGCANREDIDCLRSVSVSSLVKLWTDGKSMTDDLHWAAYGDDVVPDTPMKLIDDGKFHNVPYIAGATSAEAWVAMTLVSYLPDGLDANVLKCAMNKSLSPDEIQVVSNAYPLEQENPLEELAVLVQLFTDMYYRCPNFETLQGMHEADNVHALFTYDFAKVPDCNAIAPGAWHGVDIAYVFNNLKSQLGCSVVSQQDQQTANTIGRLWTSFAGWQGSWDEFATANAWPRHFGRDEFQQTLKINGSLSVEKDFRKSQCAALNKVGLDWLPSDRFPILNEIQTCKSSLASTIVV